MALLERTIDSVKLGRKNKVRVWVPDSGKKVYPAVYFLHGTGDDADTPWKVSGLVSYAEKYELIIVTSDADISWYCNDRRTNTLWEDYFAFELPDYIEYEFPAGRTSGARGQCGFSMGGYGAIMFSFLHPDRFSAVSTHSSSLIFGHEYRENRPERAVLMEAVAPPGGRYDLFLRAADLSDRRELIPAIRFDIGADDRLLEQNRRFHACLTENGIPHDYHEYPGIHEWDYVDGHLEESLAFFSEKLKV